MKKYLIQIHIGPVQDFISTARRTRDLWFSSNLLCSLAKEAVEKLLDAKMLIFPYSNKVLNTPNKVLAVLEVQSEESLINKMQEIKEAVKNALTRKRDNAFKRVKGEYDRESAEQQVEDMLEFYWVAVEYDESNYALSRRKLEYLMSARKATRNFGQVFPKGSNRANSWGSDVPKSSLDGARESVIPEKFYPKNEDSEQEKQRKANELYQRYKIRENERLCGVGLLKRLGQISENADESDEFYSTAHIAALPFLKSAKNNEEAKKAVEDFKKTLISLGLDESELRTTPKSRDPHPVFDRMDAYFLFAERMVDFFEEEKEKPEEERKINKAQQAVKELLDKVFGEGRKPLPYYAILHADGDRMGKLIDSLENPEEHRNLSEKLNEFAKSVKKIVEEEHGGCLVYSGGDDVLALMPLDTVLECARDISRRFNEILNAEQSSNSENARNLENSKSSSETTPSISIGVAIVHYIEPLQSALKLAHLAEREAKKISKKTNKGATAISVDKRSGVLRTIADNTEEMIERLQKFIEFDDKDDISHQTAYALREVALKLEAVSEDKSEWQKLSEEEKKIWGEMAKDEALRILKRKLTEVGQKELDKEKYKTIIELIERHGGIRQFVNELLVAKLIGDAKRQAEGKL